jgi:hypothetical protein
VGRLTVRWGVVGARDAANGWAKRVDGECVRSVLVGRRGGEQTARRDVEVAAEVGDGGRGAVELGGEGAKASGDRLFDSMRDGAWKIGR